MQSGPSYRPNQAHYASCPYPSRQPNHLTDAHGALIGQFIDAARDRGLKVYLQVAATGPSQLDRQGIPHLPDGRLPANRMANTGSLASAAIRHYNRAYIADLLEHYPQITGFRPDWPEYPCYKLDEAFQDFGPPVAAWAAENGFDFTAIRQEVGAFYNYLHGSLKNEDLEDWASTDRGKLAQLTLLRRYPGVLQWLQLKGAGSGPDKGPDSDHPDCTRLRPRRRFRAPLQSSRRKPGCRRLDQPLRLPQRRETGRHRRPLALAGRHP